MCPPVQSPCSCGWHFSNLHRGLIILLFFFADCFHSDDPAGDPKAQSVCHVVCGWDDGTGSHPSRYYNDVQLPHLVIITGATPISLLQCSPCPHSRELKSTRKRVYRTTNIWQYFIFFTLLSMSNYNHRKIIYFL